MLNWMPLLVAIAVIGSCTQLLISYKRSKSKITKGRNNPQKARELIINHFSKAGKSVRIFSSSGFAKVYNDSDVIEAFKEAHNRSVKIDILVEKDTLDNSGGENALEDLHKNKIIELFKGVGPEALLNHFRIIDKKLLYIEEQDHLCKESSDEEEKPYIIYEQVQSEILPYIRKFDEVLCPLKR
ncbi:MAG: hypothetical protein L6406_22755 [Desulfobacterales bacterium]|nr:hypothetical protein [Desulfobacterales bacterium]